MYEFSSKPTNFTRIFSSQNLPTLRAPSVPKTCQLYVYLPSPTSINFTCTFCLQHLSILRISSVSNIQNPCPGFHSSDSLMLALLAKMRSSIYAGFREGPPTLVNIAGVNAQICVASGCLTSGSLGMGSSVREKVLPVREKVSSVYQKGQIYSKLAMC